ncbi:Solute carrier organic anion transporter family member 4A1 [Trichoplax sp. H2]|nr:Solute carrier organic anion transporter family member 4A1 [Trichoplax sp. H2]|eukprot:RDD42163.1 Solute carrier organic anion transporter family member 4A1 [Trichoplax sp. H2]
MAAGTEAASQDFCADIDRTNSTRNSLDQDQRYHDALDTTIKSRFGYFKWSPDFLQVINKPRWLLFIIAMYFTVASMQVTGLRAVVVRPLERRFNITSTQVGLIVSVNEITASAGSVLFTYFASQGHKGQWLGYGALTFGIGSLLFSTPQFITEKYVYSDLINQSDLCSLSSVLSNTSTGNTCQQKKVYSSDLYTAIFIGAQIIIGLGVSTVYNVSIAYADENVSPKSSPIYVGIINSMAALGPALGFLLGGILLNIYIDWPSTPSDLTPSDPRWIGAWWLGYVITAILLFLIAIPMLGFPKHLPNYQRYRAERKALSSAKEDVEFKRRLSDFPKALYELLTNKVLMCTIMAFAFEEVNISGLSSFLPKYIDSQFSLGLSTSVLIAGAVTVVGGAGGIIIGGVVMKYLNLYEDKTVKFCALISLIGLFLSLGLLIKCDSPPFAGVNIPYHTNISSNYNPLFTANITGNCNLPCHCNEVKYNLICGLDGKSYFSPCHAGCRKRILNSKTNIMEYYDCECINTSDDFQSKEGTLSIPVREAYGGNCQGSCSLSIPFFILLAFIMISTFLNVAPGMQIILRSVPENQNAFAVGLMGTFARLIGGLIGPVIFGVILDHSCSLWDENCNQRGFCWAYHNDTLSLLVFAAMATFKSLKLIAYLLAWHFYPVSQESNKRNCFSDNRLKEKSNTRNISDSPKSKIMLITKVTTV